MMPLPDISVVNTLYVCVCVLFTQIHVDICIRWKVDWNPTGCTVAALPEGGCHAAIPSYPFFFLPFGRLCARFSRVRHAVGHTNHSHSCSVYTDIPCMCIHMCLRVCVCARFKAKTPESPFIILFYRVCVMFLFF